MVFVQYIGYLKARYVCIYLLNRITFKLFLVIFGFFEQTDDDLRECFRVGLVEQIIELP